jgi:ubiquinone/menaquinone biosynthesis C-methylase UbiE
MDQHDNTKRFTGRASEYDRFRERYDPAVLLPRLRSWCGLTPDWLVADIGAGTGMLADVFLENGNRVLAVEPNSDMRFACEQLHGCMNRLRIIEGAAEATTLPPDSVDLVCVGRAFHWFDVDRAMDEFRRILKPDGWFVSIAFGRSQDGRPENVAIEALLQSLAQRPTNTRESYAKYARLPELLQRDYYHDQLSDELSLPWPAFLGLNRSLSHTPLPIDPDYPAFEQALRALFQRYATDDAITLATQYWINVGRL